MNAPFGVRLGIYFGAVVLANGAFRALNGVHRGRAIVPSLYNVPSESESESKKQA